MAEISSVLACGGRRSRSDQRTVGRMTGLAHPATRMETKTVRTLLTAALLTAVTLPAQAMTYSYKLEGADAIVINATGEIMLGRAALMSEPALG
jgi:hypothetical protein